MSLKSYGVLKGRPVNRQTGSGSNPHYQVHVVDNTTDYRIAVNVKSQLAPSDVEYLVVSHFQHPILNQLKELPQGWKNLQREPGGMALDFIRSNLFDPRELVPLPANVSGPDNDLNEKIDQYIQRAMSDEDAVLYAFGERWGPEPGLKDKIFGFLPGNGVHDIHMNQANSGDFTKDDGVYQDGALLLHFPAQNQWVGIFLKFQSQGWHSDDHTGHIVKVPTSGPPSDNNIPDTPFPPGGQPSPNMPDGAVRIVAAMVNGVSTPETETVTLLNVTSRTIDLTNWRLLDRDKHAQKLSGSLAAGETLRVTLKAPVTLPNKGGLITLVNADGLRVDGVSYTKEQAANPGFSVKF
ncbi:hypothetical protein GCM10027277_55360 [Pseudoduganella ginsengisoli]|uniref:DUF2278 family protein n=1 Tax=Pseudoduganella ginsengisoli TaxID=1462440 RepID=A0A6L6Q759_9BURK|nr:DUF2278 family protein [Pseudoduganella ginsengisoli]MTW04972.1 DUF2278 family protein [Pseudoduganella ginsengisoli]